jgi:hypothetical protein
MHIRMRACVAVAAAIVAAAPPAIPAEFANPTEVKLLGYDDDAMEPFLSRDDRILFFNNRNDPKINTDLHWAERVDAVTFRYRGPVGGVNTPALEGVPTMDRAGNFYFVSTLSYEKTLSTVYRGRFDRGQVRDVEIVEGLSLKRPGMVNFDVEVSADGNRLYAVDGDLTGGAVPKSADIFVAERDGRGFKRVPNSAEIFARINTSDLEYAVGISADERELFFTRLTGALIWRKLAVFQATRGSITEPFGEPRRIAAIDGYVEAPTISADGRALYYHCKVDGKFRIYRVTR